jgi:hypothetical protein
MEAFGAIFWNVHLHLDSCFLYSYNMIKFWSTIPPCRKIPLYRIFEKVLVNFFDWRTLKMKWRVNFKVYFFISWSKFQTSIRISSFIGILQIRLYWIKLTISDWVHTIQGGNIWQDCSNFSVTNFKIFKLSSMRLFTAFFYF